MILSLGDFAVVVGPTCSGYEGIGLMTVFVAAFLAWFRDRLRFPAAFLLLPLGVLAAAPVYRRPVLRHQPGPLPLSHATTRSRRMTRPSRSFVFWWSTSSMKQEKLRGSS